MTDATVKRFILALAIQAEIEGMKAFNAQRVETGQAVGYQEDAFFASAEDLRILAAKHDNEL